MKVAVFCSCSDKVSPMLLSEMEKLGESLAEDGHEVIYGGSTGGCMEALARGVLQRRGRLVGVIPEMDFMHGLVRDGLSERRLVATLSERKVQMIETADAFVVFPGGLGTLDEALDVLALKSAGELDKTVVFYNFLGIWTPLIEALTLLHEQGLVRHALADLFHVLDNLEQLRENLRKSPKRPEQD